MPHYQRLVIDPSQKQDQLITFTKPQQHYLYRVLRLQGGDQVIVLDGLGGSWLVIMTGAGEGMGEILELWEVNHELPIAITLIVALPKNGFDEVVYQATELGVGRVIPMISDRTLLRPSPQKVQRWRSIAQEATEQSERQIVPQIVDPVSFRQGLELTADLSHKYICTPRQNAPSLSHLLAELKLEAIKELVVLTGCEGGFTEQEVEGAIDQKFQSVSLGKTILRAVTAPIVALALIASRFARS
jgi:16S rRNA (uracil1498-N3)-methyltransferase